MRILGLAGMLLLSVGWTDAPPPISTPPQPQYQYRVLTPPPPQPYRPQLPMGPAQGSIERCLQIQQRGGLSC